MGDLTLNESTEFVEGQEPGISAQDATSTKDEDLPCDCSEAYARPPSGIDVTKPTSGESETKFPCKIEEEVSSTVQTTQETVSNTSSRYISKIDAAIKPLQVDLEEPIPFRTLYQCWENLVEKYRDRHILVSNRGGVVNTWSYNKLFEDFKIAAKAFIKLGLRQFDVVSILAHTSPEWLTSFYGAIFAGGCACGIYLTNSPEACHYILDDSQTALIVVDTIEQLQKILQIKDRLPNLKTIVLTLGEPPEGVYSWSQIMDIGRAEDDTELNSRVVNLDPLKCCSLLYTSGTTGKPKGAMLSHDNYLYLVQLLISFVPTLGQYNPDGCVVSYLPLSHIAGQFTDCVLFPYIGRTVHFAKPTALKGSLVETLVDVRPTDFFSIPRVYEKMQNSIEASIAGSNFVKRWLMRSVMAEALEYHNRLEKGEDATLSRMARIVLGKVHSLIGFDRINIAVVGSAPISASTVRFFKSLNLPLCDAYGMSETCAVLTISHRGRSRQGSCGPVVKGLDVVLKNVDEEGCGEICCRGRSILLGYLGGDDKNAESIDEEGYFHTGDLGKFDSDGFLFITGRIKELIITAGGENIAPVPIEEAIKGYLPFVSFCMLIGDQLRFLSCVLTFKVVMGVDMLPTDELSPEAIKSLEKIGVKGYTTSSELVKSMPEALKSTIDKTLETVNKSALSHAQRVQKWIFLPKDFSIPGGELGPTMKLRRSVVAKLYHEQVMQMYA